MKLFILLVCLLVVATKARHNHPSGIHTELGDGPHPPPCDGAMPNFTKALTAEERTSLFKHAHDLRVNNCTAAGEECPRACAMFVELDRMCNGQATQDEPVKSICDIYKAVTDENYPEAELVYGRLEAFMPEQENGNQIIPYVLKFIRAFKPHEGGESHNNNEKGEGQKRKKRAAHSTTKNPHGAYLESIIKNGATSVFGDLSLLGIVVLFQSLLLVA